MRRPTRKRNRMLASVLAAATLLLSACGSGGGKSSSVRLYNDKAAWTTFYNQMGSASKQQIGVGLTPTGYSDEPTYQAAVKTALKTNVRPDLFTWFTGPQLEDLVNTGQVADSSALWQTAVQNGDLPKGLEQYYTVNGKQYCVPENVSYWVMFYNKQQFAKAGITAPPTTWADLMADADKLKQQNIMPFYQTNVLFSFVWFQILVAGSDPDLYTKLTQGAASYTDPVVVKAMEQWRDMIGKGYMSDPGDKTDPATLLKTGKVAMVPDGTWFNTSMTQAGMKPGQDYGMFVIPAVNPALTKIPVPVESGALCTPNGTKDPATATKFLTWWLGSEAQTQWANSRGDVSANTKVAIPDPGLSELAKSVGGDGYQLVNRYFDAVKPNVLTAALDAFGAFMAKPDSYQQQLTTLQQANAG